MDNKFGICVNTQDIIQPFVASENIKSMKMFDWQIKAAEFFFQTNKAIFQCATGCLSGDSLIEMPRNLDRFPKGILLKDLVNKKDFYIYSFNIERQIIELKKVKNVWLSKKNEDVYEITTNYGKKIKATKNHPFLVDIKEGFKKKGYQNRKTISREYRTVENLRINDYLTTFNRSIIRNKDDGELIKIDYNSENYKRRCYEHRFIVEEIINKLDSHDIVHHKDGKRFNNEINNLEIMNSIEHNRYHTKKRGFFGRVLWEKIGHPKGMKGKYHSEETKAHIALNVRLSKNNKEYIKIRKDNHSEEFKNNGFESYLYKTNKIESCFRCSESLRKRGKRFLSKRSIYGGNTRYSERIIKIRYIGKEDVYDMEVEDNHNFIANNFIVHNSGKTFFAIEVIKKYIEKEPKCRILIIVPKNVILDGWYNELYKNGISIKDIGVYYGAVKEYAKITISNMQNVENLVLELFDFIILDELHNYVSKRLLKILAHPFKYKMGLSATVERKDNKHYKILELFDYRVFNYTAEEALYDKILNPFDFTNIGVYLDAKTYDEYDRITTEINELMRSFGGFFGIMKNETGIKMKFLKLAGARKQLVNNYIRKFEVVKKLCKLHENDKIIVFNEYNSITTKSYYYLLDEGIKSCIVHSGVSKEKREQNLVDFKNDKYQVMLTSKVLDEGYNLPSIDTAIISAGNSSARQTIQRMGRVLRKKIKESNLYQIYCINTIEEKYAEDRAKILRNLCSHYNEYRFNLQGEFEL